MLIRPVSQHALRQRQMGKDVCLLSLSVDQRVSGGDTRLTHLTPSALYFRCGGVRANAETLDRRTLLSVRS